jgi:hypothetical protein
MVWAFFMRKIYSPNDLENQTLPVLLLPLLMNLVHQLDCQRISVAIESQTLNFLCHVC